MRRRRITIAGHRFRVISVALTILAACLAPVATAAAAATQASVFHAFTGTGKPTIPVSEAPGFCWTGSNAINRADAWRCFVGNYIYDPCFASAVAPSVVVCPNSTLSAGIEIRLTKPLPDRMADPGIPSVKQWPWMIETTTGAYCVAATGMGDIVDKHRLNYFCNRGGDLWGHPDRSAQPLWTILIAPSNASRLSSRIQIRRVWM